MSRPLILCLGNRDRGDDAAGLLVADALHARGIPAEICCADSLALLERWTGCEDVIVVDAVQTGGEPGTISIIDAASAAIERNTFRTSSHSFGLAEAILLARPLGRLPERLTIMGIEAGQMARGTAPSERVRQAAEILAERLAAGLVPELPLDVRKKLAQNIPARPGPNRKG